MGLNAKASPEVMTLKQLDWLLVDVCVQRGFCNGLTASALSEGSDPLTSQAFADAVLVAADMVPDQEKSWRKQLTALFESRFGPTLSLRGGSVEPVLRA